MTGATLEPLHMELTYFAVEILASGSQSRAAPDIAPNTEVGELWPEVDVTSAFSDGTDDTEEPNPPQHTPSVSADTQYRLDVDLGSTRFSLGDALSTLYASFCGTSGPDPATDDSLVVDSDEPALAPSDHPSSSCGSEFLVVTDEMAQLSTDDLAAEAGTGSVRRAAPEARTCPPTWRHAMYISSLVWPSQREREARLAKRDKPLPPVKTKSHWCGVDSLARALRIPRQT